MRKLFYYFLFLCLIFPLSNAAPAISGVSIIKDIPTELSSQPTKFIFSRNLITGEKYIHDLRIVDKPSPVRRIRLLFSTSQAVASNNEAIDVFHMKLRWVDPDFWNDNFNETNRSYKILCEIEDENTGQARNFLALTIPPAFNGYDEKYIFPRMPLIARCKIRVQNSAELESEWTSSPSVKLYSLFDPPLEAATLPPTMPEDEPFFHKKFHNGRFRHHHRNQYWTHFRTA